MKYIMDDTGSIIDMETRDFYDYIPDVVDLLNDQDKQIFLLKSVIQTITAEAYEEGSISRYRITKIKDYWFEKLKGEII